MWSLFQAPIHLWLRCFPSGAHFLCIWKHSWKRMRFENVHAAPSTEDAITPPALSPKDSCKRELLQEKMWRLTPGKKLSTAKSAPAQSTEHVPSFPGTNILAVYCVSPILYHLSILLKYLPVRLQRPATSCFLTKIAHFQNTWYFFIAVQQRHVLQFLHNSSRSELLWPCCSFTDNASHLIHRQWHIKCPFGESPTIISLAFREQSSDSTVHAISGRNWRAFLLHLMSLVGIELQSLRVSFHWQLMKNNGQLLYLDFTQGRAFPTDTIWIKFQKWAPQGKQKVNT